MHSSVHVAGIPTPENARRHFSRMPTTRFPCFVANKFEHVRGEGKALSVHTMRSKLNKFVHVHWRDWDPLLPREQTDMTENITFFVGGW